MMNTVAEMSKLLDFVAERLATCKISDPDTAHALFKQRVAILNISHNLDTIHAGLDTDTTIHSDRLIQVGK